MRVALWLNWSNTIIQVAYTKCLPNTICTIPNTILVKYHIKVQPNLKYNVGGVMMWFNYKFDYQESQQQRPGCDTPLKLSKTLPCHIPSIFQICSAKYQEYVSDLFRQIPDIFQICSDKYQIWVSDLFRQIPGIFQICSVKYQIWVSDLFRPILGIFQIFCSDKYQTYSKALQFAHTTSK